MDVVLTLDLIKGANLKTPRFTTPGPVTNHLDAKGYEVTTGLGRPGALLFGAVWLVAAGFFAYYSGWGVWKWLGGIGTGLAVALALLTVWRWRRRLGNTHLLLPLWFADDDQNSPLKSELIGDAVLELAHAGDEEFFALREQGRHGIKKARLEGIVVHPVAGNVTVELEIQLLTRDDWYVKILGGHGRGGRHGLPLREFRVLGEL